MLRVGADLTERGALGEPWLVLFDLVAEVTPCLISVDGEEERSTLCAERFLGVPRHRCLWRLARALVRLLHYEDRVLTSSTRPAPSSTSSSATPGPPRTSPTPSKPSTPWPTPSTAETATPRLSISETSPGRSSRS